MLESKQPPSTFSPFGDSSDSTFYPNNGCKTKHADRNTSQTVPSGTTEIATTKKRKDAKKHGRGDRKKSSRDTDVDEWWRNVMAMKQRAEEQGYTETENSNIYSTACS